MSGLTKGVNSKKNLNLIKNKTVNGFVHWHLKKLTSFWCASGLRFTKLLLVPKFFIGKVPIEDQEYKAW